MTDGGNLDLDGSCSIDMTRKGRLFRSQCPGDTGPPMMTQPQTKTHHGFFPSVTCYSSSGASLWLSLLKSHLENGVAFDKEQSEKRQREAFKVNKKVPDTSLRGKWVLTLALGQMSFRGWFLDFPRPPLLKRAVKNHQPLKLQIIAGVTKSPLISRITK